MTVPQIAGLTGLHRAVVRRCLYTLSALGFVYSADNRHYHLLPRVLTIGHAYLHSSSLARQAQTALDYLSMQLDESCSVATLDGDNKQGYAINDQQLELGLRSLAVPMYSRKGGVVAAMNVGTHVAEVSLTDLQDKFLPRLQRAAMELALLL